MEPISLVAYAHLIHIDFQRSVDWRCVSGYRSFVLLPLQRFNNLNDHLQTFFSLIHYLIIATFFSTEEQTNCCWLDETEAIWNSSHLTNLHTGLHCIWAAMSHLFTTSGTCTSQAALQWGIDFQIMTLFLVKSTLVSCCVYTSEIVCLISRITVSNAYFLFEALCEASQLILNGIHDSSSGENTPAAAMSGCVSTGDLWEHTWDHLLQIWHLWRWISKQNCATYAAMSTNVING